MCAAGVPRSAACMRAFQQPKILIAVLVGPFFDSVSSLLTVLLLIDETFVCYLPTVFQVNSPMWMAQATGRRGTGIRGTLVVWRLVLHLSCRAQRWILSFRKFNSKFSLPPGPWFWSFVRFSKMTCYLHNFRRANDDQNFGGSCTNPMLLSFFDRLWNCQVTWQVTAYQVIRRGLWLRLDKVCHLWENLPADFVWESLTRCRRCLRDFSVTFWVMLVCPKSVFSNGQNVKDDRDINSHPHLFSSISIHQAAYTKQERKKESSTQKIGIDIQSSTSELQSGVTF